MRVLLCSLWIGVILAALAPGRAAGQSASERASQYADAGIAAQGRGDYDVAVALYWRAYQVIPHPVLIFDMAQARRLAGRIEQARALYARYLALDPDSPEAEVARQLIAELGAGTAATDAADAAAGQARTADSAPPLDPVHPGLAIAGSPASGERGPLARVSSRSEPAAPGTQPRSAAGSREPAVTMEGDDGPRSTGMLTRRRKLAIGAAATAAAAAATGLVFGALAQQREHDAFALCPDPTVPCERSRPADDLIDAAWRRALVANLAFGVAAAAAIGAGALWFTGAPDGERGRHVGMVPSLARGTVGVALQGGF